MAAVTSYKHSAGANANYQIQDPSSNKVLAIQNGALTLTTGGQGALWQYSLDDGSVKNVATGQYIGPDLSVTSSPTHWTILDNGDGTVSFQLTANGSLATLSAGAALSLSASKSGGHTWKLVSA